MATNKWNIPEHEFESLARCFIPDIIAFYESEEGKEEFARWKAEQDKLKDKQNTEK